MIDDNQYPDFRNIDYNDELERGIDVNPRVDQFNNAYCLAGEYSPTKVYKFALSSLDDIMMQQVTLDQFPLSYYSNHPYEVDKRGNCVTTVDIEGTSEKERSFINPKEECMSSRKVMAYSTIL